MMLGQLRICAADAAFDASTGGFKDSQGDCNPCTVGQMWSNAANNCVPYSVCPMFYQERKPDGSCGVSMTIVLAAGGAVLLLLLLSGKRR